MPFKTCGKCEHYSYPLRRCKLAKANPRSLKGTKEAMEIMGMSYVCGYSKWKIQAVMHFVHRDNDHSEKNQHYHMS